MPSFLIQNYKSYQNYWLMIDTGEGNRLLLNDWHNNSWMILTILSNLKRIDDIYNL